MPLACQTAWARLEIHEASRRLPFVLSPYGSPRTFFPLNSIRNIIDTYGDALFCCTCDRCGRHAKIAVGPNRRQYTPDLHDDMMTTYATIFALLIYLQCPGLIHIFLDHGVYLRVGHGLKNDDLQFLVQSRLDKVESLAICKKILKLQGKFEVLRLEMSKNLQVIGASQVIPIENEKHIASGAFSDVFAGDVRVEYLDDRLRQRLLTKGTTHRYITLALKIIRRNRPGASIKEEWQNTLRCNTTEHPHIMPPLFAFQYGTEKENPLSVIALELADGTLESLLSGKSNQPPQTSMHFWSQIKGITEGLQTLHQTNILHLDLKPRNILIVNGIMKIADFGIVQWIESGENERLRLSESDQSSTSSKGLEHNHDYAPPIDLIVENREESKKFDVYCLGATLSDVACFRITGVDGLKQYRQSRRDEDEFDRPNFHINGETKSSVSEQHEHLRALVKVNEDNGVTEHLDYQEQYFLDPAFFDIVNKILDIYSQKKPAAQIVAQLLSHLHAGRVRASSNALGA